MERTHELKSAVEAVRLRSNATLPEAKQRLLANGSSSRAERTASRGDFAKQALAIAKEIQNSQAKLDKLGQREFGALRRLVLTPAVAKRKTLFDDRPVEISVRQVSKSCSDIVEELTFIIKRDIANLNGAIGQLQQTAKARSSGPTSSRQQDEHNSNVVVMLQAQLASASLAFKDVLEIRTQNMKASRSRTEQFGGTVASGSGSNEPASDSPLYASSTSRAIPNGSSATDVKGKGRAAPGNSDFLMLDMAGGGAATQGTVSQQQGDFMQMQQMEQQDTYLQSRSTAIESIESTIAELGQLSQLVAAQGETVQRIDADTSDIAQYVETASVTPYSYSNVSGAQSELLKYYASVSSNRALMLKDLVTCALAALTLSHSVAADLAFSAPIASTNIRGGSPYTLRWRDTGTKPSLADFGDTTFELCVGGRTADACMAELGSLDVSKASSLTVTIPPSAGPSADGSYFVRARSANIDPTLSYHGYYLSYSAKFDTSGMTGKLSAADAAIARDGNASAAASAGSASAASGSAGSRTTSAGVSIPALKTGSPTATGVFSQPVVAVQSPIGVSSVLTQNGTASTLTRSTFAGATVVVAMLLTL